MADRIKVAVLGACGKMGREVVRAVAGASDMVLVGACDVVSVGEPLQEAPEVVIRSDFANMLVESKPDVVVDFAKPFVLEYTRLALENGVVPIIGTTGQTAEELAEIGALTRQTGTPAMVIPNFAVGAVLMMKFAALAAAFMPDVEIVELHHDRKADAPSGTSIKTAEMIEAARKAAEVQAAVPAGSPDDRARGDEKHGVRIHSVRLPGLVAHQEVIFGGPGQVLTIRHDSMDRTSFMPGVLLAIRRALNAQGLTYGLDKVLWE
ncbi:MAG: 4-hydroxy-tetrahydrodipicolinate reductase [Armatimonadota bacterium]